MKARVDFNDPTLGPGAFKYESESQYVRFLLEAQARQEFWEGGLAAVLGVGAGVAYGRTIGTSGSEGAAFVQSQPNSPGNSASSSARSRTWARTWELSLGLAYPAGDYEFRLGARMSQFPRIPSVTDDSGSESVFPVAWKPSGVYFSVLFP